MPVVVAAAFILLVASASSAWGALSFPFDGQLTPSSGSFGDIQPNGVAIDDANSDVYVADSTADVVEAFDAEGHEVLRLDGSTTPDGSFGAGGSRLFVAANNGTGEVYVLDSAHGVVDVFDAAGSYVCQITGRAVPSASECNGVSGSETPAGGFASPTGGIAIDQATGQVYVLDPEQSAVDIFDVAGAFERQIELSAIPGGFFAPLVKGLAVSAFDGHVFVGEGASAQVFVFDATGAFTTAWTGANTPAGAFNGEVSVASDDTSERIYVSDINHAVTDVFNPSGEFLTQFSHAFHSPKSTAVDQATGRVYVADGAEAPTPQVVDIFGPAVVVPDVRTGEPTSVLPTQAVVGGGVNPDNIQLTDCHVEFGPTTTYGRSAPCVPSAAAIPADATEHEVTAELTGLEPGATYHYRLVAANENGVNQGGDATLATPPRPAIDAASTANLTPTTAELVAEINPNGFATTYHFEWGTTSAYGNRSADEVLEPTTRDERVSVVIGDLSEGKTYHWRVVATSVNGETVGVDHTFVFLRGETAGGCPNEAMRVGPSANLPECRAYEMVTPPQKNGALIGSGLVIVNPDVAANGSRVIVASIQCFGGTASCSADRLNEGEPYEFARGSDGWTTTPLAPAPSSENANSTWIVSADTGTVLFSMASPPGGQDNFYAHELGGALVNIGPSTVPADGALGPAFGRNALTATPDATHVAYQLITGLWPFDASIGSSVYELAGSDATEPVLVGVSGGPGSRSLISECGTQLGEPGSHHAMSADGSIIYFVAAGHSGGCTSGVLAPPVDELYARIGRSQTVAISRAASQDCTTPACLNAPPSDARFEDASQDGSKVFFTDTQQLTDSASDDETASDSAGPNGSGCNETTGTNGCNLYLYDFANAPGHNLVDASAGDTSGLGPEVQRVMGASADGSHVYFVARGVLTGAANNQGSAAVAGGENLYVFEHMPGEDGGHVAFIATLAPTDREESAFGTSVTPSVTPDGAFFVFTSHAALTGDDTSTSGAAQVFRYDAPTGELVRISVGEQGFNDNGNTERGQLNAAIANPTNILRRDPTMSNDGQYVFFTSPVALTPRALDAVEIGKNEQNEPVFAQNVYVYHSGHIGLISDGKDVAAVSRPPHAFGAVELIGSDESGQNVFFTTADQLVGQDTDTQVDYYDARVGGGFPATGSVTSCEGADGCHGITGAAQVAGNPASTVPSAEGNLLAAPIVAAKPSPRLTRAQKLRKALAACHRKREKRKRVTCEALARKRFGPLRTNKHRKRKAGTENRRGR